MLCSNIIAIQHQDIKDVDGTDFSLGFPLMEGNTEIYYSNCWYFSFGL